MYKIQIPLTHSLIYRYISNTTKRREFTFRIVVVLKPRPDQRNIFRRQCFLFPAIIRGNINIVDGNIGNTYRQMFLGLDWADLI